MPATRSLRNRARTRTATGIRHVPAVRSATRLVHHSRIQPKKKPFSVIVKQFHNKTSDRSWVTLDFVQNATGEKKSFRVSTKTYNEWRKKYSRDGGKGNMATAMAIGMAKHPEVFKSIAHMTTSMGKDIIPALFDFI